MSIRSEILHLLNINSHTETRELAGTIVLPVSFTGFQGHFPGNPTLPGVCEIMILKELLRQVFQVILIKLIQVFDHMYRFLFLSFLRSSSSITTIVIATSPTIERIARMIEIALYKIPVILHLLISHTSTVFG